MWAALKKYFFSLHHRQPTNQHPSNNKASEWFEEIFSIILILFMSFITPAPARCYIAYCIMMTHFSLAAAAERALKKKLMMEKLWNYLTVKILFFSFYLFSKFFFSYFFLENCFYWIINFLSLEWVMVSCFHETYRTM